MDDATGGSRGIHHGPRRHPRRDTANVEYRLDGSVRACGQDLAGGLEVDEGQRDPWRIRERIEVVFESGTSRIRVTTMVRHRYRSQGTGVFACNAVRSAALGLLGTARLLDRELTA